ncbi:sensor histidine kinase, partial [Halorhodospira neutriphila]
LSAELPRLLGLSWIAEAMGVVLLAPPLLAVGWPGRPAVRHLEGVAWIAAAGAFTLAVHGGSLSAPAALAASYAVFPLILAVALRFGPAVTSAAVLAVAAAALSCTALGKGPFAQVGPVADLLSLHAHLAMLGVTGLLLAAARSERDRADRQAREHLHTLARAGRLGAVSSLAGGIAHEVNQPLAAANSYAQGAQRMLRAGRPREEVAAALEAVVRGNERAAEVVRRLRAFLRSDAGEREAADLNTLVGEAIELVIPEYRRHRIGLLSDRHPEPLAVWADPVAIRQVVVNLLQNALEAVLGGEGLAWVQVTTRRDPGGRWGEVAVADSGPG